MLFFANIENFIQQKQWLNFLKSANLVLCRGLNLSAKKSSISTPHQDIPANHWNDYKIEREKIYIKNKETHVYDFVDDNFPCQSRSFTADLDKKPQKNYCDIHVSGASARWIKQTKKAFQKEHLEQKMKR